MSLLDVRKERKRVGARTRRPPSLLRLIVLLAMVLGIIWWLGRVT